MRVLLAVAFPGRQEVFELALPEGSTVDDALAAAKLGERFPGVDFTTARTGIWSRPCVRGAMLREGDRVELYRPLGADPKQMRRSRVKDGKARR